ncbi:hypothetical protein [Flaviflexus huanghaiensis]|uniref:hypothetical protein n=1 Tax=Flaviflexus huanghaiensis TaxID=1111473 RepID=UPI0015F9B501|nr:hypothetical protein [Flaviflexus huanghaiensis]
MIALSSRLALSRIKTNRSGLDVLAVTAFAVTTLLALTVTGGTSMFVDRMASPPQALVDVATLSEYGNRTAREFAETYVYLAAVASAILVVPIFGLGGGAARLGASGRARRLASLRLIGMTGGEVVLMSVIESIVLTLAGAALGTMLFLLSLPLWQFVSFQGQPLSSGEMVGPLWANGAVIVLIVALSGLSTAIGLQRVVISPLGVAHRETPKALKFWRVIAFVAAVVAFIVVSRAFNLRESDAILIATISGMLIVILFTVNLIGPWIIQLVARPFTRASSPSTLLASRRLISQPRDAWRNISALAFIGFIAAFVSGIPEVPDDPLTNLQLKDIGTGALVTLVIGLIVAATSTLINQAAFAVDRADQTVALSRMGTPRSVLNRARHGQVLLPVTVTFGIVIPLGFLTMQAMVANTPDLSFEFTRIPVLIGTVIFGLILCLVAASASQPIETRILTSDYRRND